jgi:hypothetical protein
MKKTAAILAGVMLLMISFTSAAQEKSTGKNELVAGYGFLPSSDIPFRWWAVGYSVFHNIFSADSIRSSSFSGVGALNFGYRRELGRVINLGLMASFNSISYEALFDKGTMFRTEAVVLSVMPVIHAHYLKKEWISVYSGLALGGAYWKYSTDFSPGSAKRDVEHKWLFSYQFDAIGIRVGKTIAGYSEWGFGYQGSIKFGLSVKL